MYKKFIKYFIIIFIISLSAILAINFFVLSYSSKWYFKNVSELPDNYNVWLVFWASVRAVEPSDILKDRLKVAYYAYEAWKIKKIIASWDNSKMYYNEPQAMKTYLLKLWVKKEDIYLDYAWFDTFDSIYRSKHIFGADEIVFFTQWFHLKRALYIWNRLWLNVVWVETNLQSYIWDSYNLKREFLARVKAFIDIEILKVKPKFLGEKVDLNKPQILE